MLSHRPGSHRTAEPTEELRYVKPFSDTACVICTGVSQIEYHTRNVCEKREIADFPQYLRCETRHAITTIRRKSKMNETNNAVRKTVYLDEELTKRCEILFGEADVSSFSQFVTKALETYIDRLICENHSPFITEELVKAIQDEVRPIASRMSKGLYRYAVIIDMLCQIIAYQDTEWSPHELEYVRKQANVRMAKTRGNINLKELLDDNWQFINNMEDAE